MHTTNRHIRLHKDFRCRLDSYYLEIANIGYKEGDEEHKAWRRSAHIDLFVDEEGVWFVPEDDCPLGNGVVLPYYVLEDSPEVFEEIFYAMYVQSALFHPPQKDSTHPSQKAIIVLNNGVLINNKMITSLVFDPVSETVTGGGKTQIALSELKMFLEDFENLLRALLEVQIF